MSDLPLTPSDLRAIAEALDPLEYSEVLTANPLIGRIEVFRPDGDEQIGWFAQSDDWYGFVAL